MNASVPAAAVAVAPPPSSAQSQKEKEDLIRLIRDWVKDDNEIRELKKQVASRVKSNKQRTEQLLKIMRTNNVDCFDINDGALMYKKTNYKKPFTVRNISAMINEYFKNDVTSANELNDFIVSHREATVKEKIVRKIIPS